MASGIAEKPLSFYAKVAGGSLLLVGAAGILANIFAMNGLTVPDDVAEPASNITADDVLLRFGVLSFLIMYILDLVIAWALYVLLKRVNKYVALLALLFRAAYAMISSATLLHFLNISNLLNDDTRLEAMEPNQADLAVRASMDALSNGWSIGLVFFGVHLLILGYLIYRSGSIPEIFGILLMLAGIGYIIDNFAWILTSDSNDFLAILSLIVLVVAVIAELAFAVWLLLRGKNVVERMS